MMPSNSQSYYKTHYAKNRETLIARSVETTRRSRQEKRDWLNQLRAEAVCPDCEVSHPDKPWRMSFDHLPGCEKLGNVSQIIAKGWSWARLKAEVEKCEIVCLLCHADRTMERLTEGM